MQNHTGVWIDKSRAVIVNLEGENKSVKTINSEVETKVREPGESKQFGRFGDQYVDPETKKEHRQEHQIDDFVSRVIHEVKTSDRIVVFGPAQMKKRLANAINNTHGTRGKLAGLETADSMTDNQITAWVVDYFSRNQL